MKILITGMAGFIGFHLANKLITRGDEVVGLDSINDYYDVRVKYGRLDYTGVAQSDIAYNTMVQSSKHANCRFIQLQLEDKASLDKLFEFEKFDAVCNLAAQAGVRYSMENPLAYIKSNIVGFAHILEDCRLYDVEHLVYASTSSVYGANTTMPFSEYDSANHPLSVYAASKKSNELMAHTYSYLYQLPTTGLRFFTVYGPWGRPDMALFKFTKAILEGKPIDVFNHGKHTRDFTYIDDIVNGIIKTLDNSADRNLDWNSREPDPASSKAPWRIYNIGNNKSIQLMDYIHVLEKALGKKAIINFLPLQPGDVQDTFANVDNLIKKFNYKPSTPVDEGITNFVEWYKNYYKI